MITQSERAGNCRSASGYLREGALPISDKESISPAIGPWETDDVELRWLLHAAPEATAILDGHGVILHINAAMEDLVGYTPAELVGLSIDTLIPERFRAEAGFSCDSHPSATPLRLGRQANPLVLRGDGTELAAEIVLSSVRTRAAGLVIRASVYDLTQAQPAERFRMFVESAPDALVIVQADGVIVLVNAQTERLFGYSRDELIGASVDILVPEHFRSRHPQLRADFFHEPQARSMGIGLELYGLRKDGSQFPVEISLSSIDTDEGRLVSSSIRDFTERHLAAEANHQLAAIVNSSNDAIISSTLDGTIASWNHAAHDLFGYTEAEAIGLPLSILMPEGQDDEIQEMLTQLHDGELVPLHDGVRRHQDGHTLDVSISMSAIRDRRGTLMGASKVVRDICARKQAEMALSAARDAAETSREAAETSREAAETSSAAFEAFSYSVAHDLRAPLRSMDSFSALLAAEYGALLDETGHDYLTRVRSSAQHMAHLIDSLLKLAWVTHRELGTELLDLSALVTQIVDRLHQEFPDRRTNVTVQPAVTGHGDRILLSNVLENLIENAWKFTSGVAESRIYFGVDDEGYFVRDNGAGFDMAHSAKLFGVFQRLHEPQEFAGTGIGLATAQRIIQRHGGRIWAQSAVDEGTVFHFTLTSQLP